MADILEVVLAVIAVTIYGRPDAPPPAYLRNTVRVIGFAGIPVIAVVVAGIVPAPAGGRAYVLPWMACALIVLLAEHELGRTRYAVAMLVGLALLCGWLLWIEQGGDARPPAGITILTPRLDAPLVALSARA